MKKVSLKNIIVPVVVLTFLIFSMSSCQRGYGCPYKMTAKVEAKR